MPPDRPEGDGLSPDVTPSQDNPSHAFPQVNPSESVDCDGVTGYSQFPTYRDETFSNTSRPIETDGSQHPSPVTPDGLAGGDLQKHRVVAPSQPKPKASPRLLPWPGDQTNWLSLWQGKLDAARTSQGRVTVAWRVFASAIKKAKLGLDESVFVDLADHLIEHTNAIRPPPPSRAPGQAEPTELHRSVARRLGMLSQEVAALASLFAAGATDQFAATSLQAREESGLAMMPLDMVAEVRAALVEAGGA